MALKTREQLKNLFLNGLKPNQEDFAALIDALLNFTDDDVTVKSGKIGIKTTDPKGRLHVYTNGLGGNDPTKLTNDGGSFIIGNTDALNLSMDHNEILARNNGATAKLYLQNEGGELRVFAHKSNERFVFLDTGRLGIGTQSPDGRLHINGSDRDLVVSDEGNVGIGTSSPSARLHIHTSSGDIVDTNDTDAALKIGAGSGKHLAFDNNEIMAKSNTSPSTLYLNSEGGDVRFGDGNIYHGGSLIHSSDRALKKEIKPIDKGLKEVLKLKPISFKWKKKTNPNKDKKFGFIAQDVQDTLTDIVYQRMEDDTLSMSTVELIPVLVKSIQEQQTHIKSLESRIAKLEQLMKK
ncbi:MAG: hypothetical protein GY751_08820 [Bacteroidetes bacterium]|nr:hypothetical protein [Bacteroidota bacterium]